MPSVSQLDIGGEGCFKISGELGEYGDDVSVFGKVFKGVEGWLYGDGVHGDEDGGNSENLNAKFLALRQVFLSD